MARKCGYSRENFHRDSLKTERERERERATSIELHSADKFMSAHYMRLEAERLKCSESIL